MGLFGRILVPFQRRRPAAASFDTVTTALLEPGRDAFRSVVADDAPAATLTLNTRDELERALAEFVASARPGDAVTIEIPNARAAELEQLAIGVTPTELTSACGAVGLDVVDAYGVGYVPKALAKHKPFHRELAANPGVFATPEDCVLLAFRARVPLDARA